MRHARHIIAVTLMATAICADRRATAVPAEPPPAHLAGRIIARLTMNLRRVLPAFNRYQPRCFGVRAILDKPVAIADQNPGFQPVRLSPFQFRLPPPVI